jgi:hypothetical protein
MKTLLASVLLTVAIFATGAPVAGPQPGAQTEGKLVVAQRFCPNGRC